MNRVTVFAIAVLASIIAFSCSSGGQPPVVPGQQELTGAAQAVSGGTPKAVWGVWEVTVDTQTWEVRALPLRGTQFTVDVVTFLQKPAGNPANLSISVTDTTKWLTEGLLGVDVGLRHPFPGYDEYTGFDVLGVFVSPGSFAGQYDPDVTYTNGMDEPKLLNADGYTRWMNPVEFPANGTILRFVPGKLGTKDIGLFTSTINAYKYFAHGLDKAQDVANFYLDPNNIAGRGSFRAGDFNKREYYLKFAMVGGSPYLIFQYAVIASWLPPDKSLSGAPDMLDVPGDFYPSANAQEAIYLKVTDNSTLFYKDGVGGGSISLQLEVFDWCTGSDSHQVPDEIHQIVVETPSSVIPGGFHMFDQAALKATAAPGTTAISSVFQIEITDCTPVSNNKVPLLITVESEKPDAFDPGTGEAMNTDRLAAYFMTEVPVGTEIPSVFKVTSPNGGETLWMALYHEIKWNPGYTGIENVRIEWSTDNFASDIRIITPSTPNTGSFVWYPIPNVDTDTAKVRITDVLGTESDTSDNYFSIKVPVWLEFQPQIDMDDSVVQWQSYPYDTSWDDFSPALSQDLDGLAHICWHRERLNPPGRIALDCGIRSWNGNNWNGEGGFLQTWGGSVEMTPLRGDYAKVAAASNNTTFMAIQHWTVYFSADVDMWPNGHWEYNYPVLVNRIYLNCEIMADSNYLYLVSDGWVTGGDLPGIYETRVLTPNPAWPGPGPQVTMTSFGEVSHSRSWVSQDNKLMLIYYTKTGQIRITRQTDPVADTWNDSEIVFNGTGYSGCTDPSIAIDKDNRLFAIWTGRNNSTGKFEILASMKETPTGTWTTPLVVAVSDVQFDDLHVTTSADKVLLPTGDSEYLVLVGYENGFEVQSTISPMDLWAFLPTQQVSEEGKIATDPDTLCMRNPYVYDALFAWEIEITPGGFGTGNREIIFRNADFKTP